MNDHDTTTPRTGLIVVGASGRLGGEVARLGVAYGIDVVGICLDGQPPNDEPWTHGVKWMAADATEEGALDELPLGPLVVAAPIAVSEGILQGFPRVVVVQGEGVVLAAVPGDSVTLASPGEFDKSPIDLEADESQIDVDTLRVETVAMALLRAALDENLPRHLGPEEIAYFGDAVMLQ